jgi:hypothetical protein
MDESFTDFNVPICSAIRIKVSTGYAKLVGNVLVLLRPPALDGTDSVFFKSFFLCTSPKRSGNALNGSNCGKRCVR